MRLIPSKPSITLGLLLLAAVASPAARALPLEDVDWADQKVLADRDALRAAIAKLTADANQLLADKFQLNADKHAGNFAAMQSDRQKLIADTTVFKLDKVTAIVVAAQLRRDEFLDKKEDSARIPEPAALGLMGLGLIGIGFGRRWRKG